MIRSEQIALGYSTLKLSIYLTLVMTYLIWTGSSDLMVEFKWNGEHRTKSGLTVHDYCCSPPAAGFSAVGGTWPGPWAPWTTLDAGWKSQQRAHSACRGWAQPTKTSAWCSLQERGETLASPVPTGILLLHPRWKIPRKNKTQQNQTKGIFPGCLVQLLSHSHWNFIWIQVDNFLHWLLHQAAVAVLSQLVGCKSILNIVLGKI